jgi:hypothetical protein
MMTTKPTKRLLSIKETVEAYGLTVWYWRERIWGGELPVLKVGRKQVLDTRDIDAFITENKRYEAPR